jgi:HlyD family secretion protein
VSDLKLELASLRIDRDRPPGRARFRPLVVAAAVVTGAIAGYLLLARRATAGIEVETARVSVLPTPGVSTGTAILSASGYVVPRRKAVVSAKIQGRLAELRVEEGSRVKEGEVLARLESSDFLAQVEKAKASVGRAEADLSEFRRQLGLSEKLAADRIVSKDQVDAAASRVNIAAAALAQAQADLSLNQALYQNTVIRAPFTGVVLKKMAEVGESVAPIPPGVNISSSSGAIVALADLDTLEVEADVGESNVARLGPDQPAEATVEAFPDRHYRAVLRQIIPTADRTKATVQVKVTILDKDRDLRPEMTARVTFVSREKPPGGAPSVAPILTVPEDAIVSREGRPTAFEVKDGRARARSVVTGVARRGQVVIVEGLSGSETLVVRPPDTLKDGDAVRSRR